MSKNWNIFINFMRIIMLFTVRNEVAKVMFLHVSVILSTGGLPHCMLGYHPPPQDQAPPQEQTPTLREQTPPWEQTTPWEEIPTRSRPPTRRPPRKKTPQEQIPPGADTPQSRHPPQEQTPPRDGHCCGWYASYWNAFLLSMCVNIVACEI